MQGASSVIPPHIPWQLLCASLLLSVPSAPALPSWEPPVWPWEGPSHCKPESAVEGRGVWEGFSEQVPLSGSNLWCKGEEAEAQGWGKPAEGGGRPARRPQDCPGPLWSASSSSSRLPRLLAPLPIARVGWELSGCGAGAHTEQRGWRQDRARCPASPPPGPDTAGIGELRWVRPFVPARRGPHPWPRSATGSNLTLPQSVGCCHPQGRLDPPNHSVAMRGIQGHQPKPSESLTSAIPTWKTAEMGAEKGPRCRSGPGAG